MLQQVLNLLLFWLNVFSTPAGNFVVNSLEFFPRNFLNLAADILPECGDLFYILYPSNLVTNKSHKGLNQENVGATGHGYGATR